MLGTGSCSIQHIVSPASKHLSILCDNSSTPKSYVDPFHHHYPYFKAKIYSSDMGVDLEIVYIDWVYPIMLGGM